MKQDDFDAGRVLVARWEALPQPRNPDVLASWIAEAIGSHGLCDKHGPTSGRSLNGCWGCSREEETALLEEARGHVRNHHLESCESCIAIESTVIDLSARLRASEQARERLETAVRAFLAEWDAEMPPDDPITKFLAEVGEEEPKALPGLRAALVPQEKP